MKNLGDNLFEVVGAPYQERIWKDNYILNMDKVKPGGTVLYSKSPCDPVRRFKHAVSEITEAPAAKVLFRFATYEDGTSDVIAIFPTFRANKGKFECYAHVGQHAECSDEWYTQKTRQAKPEEFKDLLKELESIGYYNLRIMQRITYADRKKAWSLK